MLYYETIENEGLSEWVVFVHGLGGSTLTWKKQIEDFSKKYNLLLIDLNGHGNSQQNNTSKFHDFTDISKNIKEVIDFLNIDKAHFVGMSLGTLILVVFTILYPNSVDSLIMGGGVIKIDKAKTLLLDIVQQLKKILPCSVIYKIFSHVLMPKKNHEKSRRIFVRESLKLKKSEFIAWIASLDQLKYGDIYIELLNKIKNIPILYIMGSEDHMFLKGTVNAVKKMKYAQLSIIENCGHICTIEKYKEFNNIAINFLAINKKQKESC